MSSGASKMPLGEKQNAAVGKEPVEKAEGVDSTMGRLNLLADDTDFVEMSDDEEGDCSVPVKWSLLGMILSPSVIHISTTTSAMRPAWGNPRGLKLRNVRDNVFVADFANKSDRDRAQEGTPWMVGKHAVLLQDYDPWLRPSDIRFDSMSIWVRILNLPFEWMNNRKGLKIAKLIDKNCTVDVDEGGDASGSFLRARVSIPLKGPLRRWVTIRKGSEDVKYDLQYEKPPSIASVVASLGMVI